MSEWCVLGLLLMGAAAIAGFLVGTDYGRNKEIERRHKREEEAKRCAPPLP